MRLKQSFRFALAIALIMGFAVVAADPKVRPDPSEIKAMVDRAAAFLKTRQGANGSFSPQRSGPGISALVAAALIRHGRADDPMVQKTMQFLESAVKKDGGIYDRGLANYTTSVALIAFKEANTKGQYDALIANGTKFLKGLQFDESSSDSKDDKFGGVGYDGRSRPDLSNTAYFLDALEAAGVPKNDPAVQRALVFVSRCQNLPGETNDRPFAKKTTDEDKGGFVYSATEPKADDPRRTPDGGLRSEGAMTYAGLKSMLYAGVSKDDPRVKSAVAWLRKHYTLENSPGQGTTGLFYYYHLFGKTMRAYGEDPFVDDKGTKHVWRAELATTLQKRQKADGSWTNENGAFMENNPDLATAFALLALSYCVPAAK
jgi:squalene-hopene/tetraprenyl-beta-curcumene cyclase